MNVQSVTGAHTHDNSAASLVTTSQYQVAHVPRSGLCSTSYVAEAVGELCVSCRYHCPHFANKETVAEKDQ